jgi:hypothetical protein
MPILFLNLKRLPSLALSATCSISGKAGSMHWLARIFAKEQDAEAAFGEAGIDEHRYGSTLTSVRSGYGSFIEITPEEAEKMHLLEKDSEG